MDTPDPTERERLVQLVEQISWRKGWRLDAAAILDDLEGAAHGQARVAESRRDEDMWEVWRQVQRVRGLDLPASVRELQPSQQLSFALWSLSQGDVTEGIEAYRSMASAPDYREFSVGYVQRYVEALALRAGIDQAVAEVDRLAEQQKISPAAAAALRLSHSRVDEEDRRVAQTRAVRARTGAPPAR